MTLVQRITDLASATVAAVRAQRTATAALQQRVAAVEQTLATVTPNRTEVQTALASALKSCCDTNRQLLKVTCGI